MSMIEGDNVFVEDFEAPDDADDRNAASYQIGLEALADRTQWLRGTKLPTASLSGAGPHSVTFDGSLGQILLITTTAACAITITMTNVVDGGRYAVVLSHLHTGAITITWAGSLFHRFLDGTAVDGQPRQGSGSTVWTANAYTTGEGTFLRWTTEKGNVLPDSFRMPTLELAPGAATVRVDAAGAFVMTATLDFTGSLSSTDNLFPLWTLPAAPMVIDGAVIEVADTCTAGSNPSSPVLTLLVNDLYKLVEGVMSPWGGTSYAVGASSSNLVAIGAPNELLDGSVAGNGTGDLGARSANGQLAIVSNGGGNGLWGKPLSLNFNSGVGTTYVLHFKVRVWGRMLV